MIRSIEDIQGILALGFDEDNDNMPAPVNVPAREDLGRREIQIKQL